MRYFFLFFLLLSLVSFSQEKVNVLKVDSLFVVLNESKKQSEKINIYHAICREYWEKDSNKLAIFTEKLHKLAKILNSKKGLGVYYLNYSEIFFEKDDFKNALSFALKAKNSFNKKTETAYYLEATLQISNIYLQIEYKLEEAKLILKNNLSIALKLKNNKILVQMYSGIGAIYSFQDSVTSSIFYHKKCIPYLTKNKSKVNSIFYLKFSNLYLRLQDYENALFYINLSIDNSEQDAKFLIEARKARLLNLTGLYKKGLKLSLQNYKTIQEQKRTSIWQYNLILTNLSYSYYKLKKYDLATYYSTKVIDKKNSIPESKVECFTILAKIYFDLNHKQLARNYINKAMHYHDSLYPNYENVDLFATVSLIEEDAGNIENALFYYKKKNFIEIKNLTKLNNEKVFEMRTNFDVAAKDNNITVLKQLNNINLKEKEEQLTNLLYLSIALFFALLFLFFYVKNYRTVKAKNLIIENEKKLVSKSLVEKETLLKEIHHRVKNNLQLVISLLNIQAQKTNQNVAGFLAVSKSRILSMALIHENLYQSENLNAVNFKEYTENLIQTITNAYETQNTTIKLQINSDEVYFDIQTALPLGLIINELVNNAYKHAFVDKPTGIITLKLTQKEANFELLIGDNGAGIVKKTKDKKTLGLKMVEALVFQIDGQLKVENNIGMQYYIEFQNKTL